MPSSAGTAYITILPDTDRFVSTLVAQMKTAGVAVQSSGRDALDAAGSYRALSGAMDDAGNNAGQAVIPVETLKAVIGESAQEAVKAAVDYALMGAAVQAVQGQIDSLTASMAANDLLRGAGILGGPPGKGVATDLGSAFREISNMAQGALSALLLVAPTINIIIAALIGVVSLLTAGVIAAVAFAAALGATAIAMGFAAYKWRDLMTQANQGAETWRGALLAIETQAFVMAKGVVASFTTASESGKDLWTSIGEFGIRALQTMQPIIDRIVARVQNFINALNGVEGASSPLLIFLKTWINEWKILGSIVNEGLAGGGGLLGFFEKYEKPAKAFVEGIASVINAIRKMSAMGYGLNMDQLAEFIRNVFTALSSLVLVFPQFSNALVSVGLEVTRFLVKAEPIITTSIEIGSAILQNIVAPLVNGLLKVIEWLSGSDIGTFLVSLAGGFTLVAYAIKTLTFGRVPFVLMMTGMIKGFIALADAIGIASAAMIGSSFASSQILSVFSGSIQILIAVAAAYLLLRGPMNTVALAEKKLATDTAHAFAQIGLSAKVGITALDEGYQSIKDSFNKMNLLSRAWFEVSHGPSAMFSTKDPVFYNDALEELNKTYQEITDSAEQAIAAGTPYSDAVIANIKKMQDIAGQGLTIATQPTLSLTEATSELTPPAFTPPTPEEQAAYDDQQNAIQHLADLQVNLDAAYKAHTITAGQYATYMELIGSTANSAGKEIDLLQYKVRGASATIAEALITVQKANEGAFGGLEQYAMASGQSFTTLKADAVSAMRDLAAGVTGSGAKVNEFFQQQADVIASWKESLADSVNFVKAAWSTLGQQASVTAAQIVTALNDAVKRMRDLKANMEEAVKKGLSKQVLTQIFSLPGEEQAVLFAGLADASKKQIEDVNKAAKKSGGLATAYAETAAGAIDLTMQRLTSAIELLVSRTLGIPMAELDRMIDRRVAHYNQKVGGLKDKKVTVDVVTNYKLGGSVSHPGVKGAKGPAAIPGLPTPNPAAISKTWEAVGRAAVSGSAEGLTQDAPAVAAATALGDRMVKATSRAIGAASPAKKFIALGRDAIDGLMKGVSEMTGTLSAQMTRAGNAMVSGLRSGLIGGLESISADAVKTVQGLVDAVNRVLEAHSPSKVFHRIGRNVAEGMRLGIHDGMDGVHREMSASRIGVPSLSQRGGGTSMYGELRIRDWRSGLASLEGELEWNGAVAYR